MLQMQTIEKLCLNAKEIAIVNSRQMQIIPDGNMEAFTRSCYDKLVQKVKEQSGKEVFQIEINIHSAGTL